MSDAFQERLTKQHDEELGDGERLMLQTLLSFGSRRDVPARFLKACYCVAAREHGLADDEGAASATLAAIPDEFVMTQYEEGRETLEVAWLREPAPRDFVRKSLLENPSEIRAMLARARYFEQVESLVGLAWSDDAPAPVDLADPLTAAVRRTIELRDPTLYSWDPPGAAEPRDVLTRVCVLSAWCRRAPELRDFLSELLVDILPGLLERIPDEEVDVLEDWVSLLVVLDECHLDIDWIATAVKEHAFAREEYLVPLEELVKLRKLRPSLFDEGEWNSMKAYFTEWTHECLQDDGTDEWDRRELEQYDHENRFYFAAGKLNRIEDLALELGVALDAESLEHAWTNVRSDYVNQEDHCDDYDGTYPLLKELVPRR